LDDVVKEQVAFYDNEARTNLAVAKVTERMGGKGKGGKGEWANKRWRAGGKGEGAADKTSDRTAAASAHTPGKGGGMPGGAVKTRFTGDPKRSGYKERAFVDQKDLYKAMDAFKVKYPRTCADYWLRTCRHNDDGGVCKFDHAKPAGLADFSKEYKLDLKF
jgi:hypothetical protein